MDDGNLAVLVDAKTEYTKQLINILKLNIYYMIQRLFVESKQDCKVNNKESKLLYIFQQKLSEIPKWNIDMIKDECDIIIKNSKCDWIDELITAVFVSHTRILTSINFSKTKGKIDLNIPKTEHFIHKCFIDVARYFWKNSYLFDDRVSNYEFQKHRREAESMIEMSINETIRKELPVKNILKKYLGTDFNEEDVDDDDFDDEPISLKQKNNLKKMVMKEIENCSKEKLNKLKLILAEESKDSVEKEITTTILNEALKEESEQIKEDPIAELLTDKLEDPVIETVTEPVMELNIENLNESLKSENKSESNPEIVVTKTEPKSNIENDDNKIKIEIIDNKNSDVQIEKMDVSDSKVNVKKMDDNLDIDKLIDENLNIEELNLDNLDDLSNIKEIYIDEEKPTKKEDNLKQNIVDKYSKNKNYSFFN